MHTEHDHHNARGSEHQDHSHEHSHDHSQTHDPDHSHGHTHTHESPYAPKSEPITDRNPYGGGVQRVSPKDLALLKYMLEHNREHARELSELSGALFDADLENAADLLHLAVQCFSDGNGKLEAVIKMLEG